MKRLSQRATVVVGAGVLLIAIGLGVALVVARRGSAEAALGRLLSADTFHAKSELAINLPPRFRGVDRPFTRVTIALDGDVARHADRTPEFSGQLAMEARGRGNVFFADGQIRILRDTVLFSLDNLPVFLNPSGSLVKKWTKVETSLLRTHTPETVREAARSLAARMEHVGRDRIEGERVQRYRLTLTEEEERAVADILRRTSSGNAGLDTIARLLDAHVMKEFTVWVSGNDVRRIQAHFVRPFDDAQGEPQEFDFATLTLTFTEYGKTVTIDVPEHQLTARPDVFARMFGTGQAEEVKVEETSGSQEE